MKKAARDNQIKFQYSSAYHDELQHIRITLKS